MAWNEKLQLLRKKNGLSQEMLAQSIGVSRQTVSKWELGQMTPGVSQLIELSRFFGVSIDSMVKEEQPCALNAVSSLRQNMDDLIPFLLRAKRKTYAGKGMEVEPSRVASHDFCYAEGRMLYCDTYLGGECFAGEEAVWVDAKPVWCMNYHGRVTGEGFEGDFLKQALLHGTQAMPYRGPERFEQNGFVYTCTVTGGMQWFSGDETILRDGRPIYECRFHGGSLR